MPDAEVANLRSQIEQLSKQLNEVEVELAAWKVQYEVLLDRTSRAASSRFQTGALVAYKGRPAWGEGVVEKVTAGLETYEVRWMRADAVFMTTTEVFGDDLEPANDVAAHVGVHFGSA